MLAEEVSMSKIIAHVRRLISLWSEEDMESGGSRGKQGRYGEVGVRRDVSYV